MKRVIVYPLALATAAGLLVASGCSHHRSMAPATLLPPEFASRLGRADTIVVTNKRDLVGFSIANGKAEKVIRAVSKARQCGRTRTEFTADLQFYHDSQLLAALRFQDSHLLLGDEQEYVDPTGTLKQLGRELSRAHHHPL